MAAYMQRLFYLFAAGLAFLSAPAQAAPGPDLKVVKTCTLDPATGPTAVSCFIEVTNVGTVPSVSPVTLSDTVTAPAGTTLLNSPNVLGCNTPAGPVPATILCSLSQSLNVGKAQSSSLKFALPAQGGVFKNCVTVAQGQSPTTPADPDLANNTSCSTVNVPSSAKPDLLATKKCQLDPTYGPTSVMCVINVKNVGTAPSVAPLFLNDTPSGPSGTTYTGGSGPLGCGTTGPIGPMNCSAAITLAPGQSAPFTIMRFKLPAGGGTFKNCVTVKFGGVAPPFDANPGNNTNVCSSVTVSPSGVPDLAVTKECKKVNATTVECKVVIQNQGTAPSIAPITLTDTVGPPLYSGLNFLGWSAVSPLTNVTCSNVGPYTSPLNCSLNHVIPGGQQRVMNFAFKVKAGPFKNCVKIVQGGSGAESNLANNQACTTLVM